jgi:3'-phosphoadenosine 5'-phosphosulfate sulfotransferase (PAPS reductase)/FAD synthetase
MEEGHTKERLKALQALPLERKIGFTIARIVEWYTHYNGKVYVSFSGGKDSTVLLDIARGLFPDIKAMFVDTGLEYPEIREFVKTFDNVDIV